VNLLTSNIGRLRLIGFLEGISFIILMGVAMPLKYIWKIPEATIAIGYAHGFLFVAYCILVIPAKLEFNWNLKTTFLVLIASLLPFGTFVADYKLFKKANNS
jgi:integral membrane protein